MGWNFERTFSAYALDTITAIAFDGRDIWASSQYGISIFQYWDMSTNYEQLTPEYYFAPSTVSMGMTRLYDSYALGVVAMASHNGKMYCVKSNGITVFDQTTKLPIATLQVPGPYQSVIAVGCNGIWIPGSEPELDTDRQLLFRYDTLSDTWTTTEISGKKQFVNRDIVDGLDGFMYVTATNDHSINKVDGITGRHVSTHRINRQPYKLSVNQNKDVRVATDAGELANQGAVCSFNQTTNDVTRISATGGSLTNIGEDGISGHLWFIGGNCTLGRVRLSDKDFRFTPNATNTPQDPNKAPWWPMGSGYTIGDQEYLNIPATDDRLKNIRGLVTPPIFYQRWDGTKFIDVHVRPYLFVANESHLGRIKAYRLTSMIRVNTFDVLGTAMIATGEQNYYGDAT